MMLFFRGVIRGTMKAIAELLNHVFVGFGLAIGFGAAIIIVEWLAGGLM